MNLSAGKYLQARRIKAHQPGATVKYIAISIGATEKQVRTALNVPREPPAKLPRAKKSFTRLRPGLKVSGYTPCGHRKAAGLSEIPRMVVPSDVMAERDRRLAMQPASLTASLMGDPPAPDWHKRA